MNINFKNTLRYILLTNLVYLQSNGKKNVLILPVRFRSVYIDMLELLTTIKTASFYDSLITSVICTCKIMR